MTNRLLAVLIIFPIWLTLVLVFRRHRQWLLYYLVAAFGLTIQLVFLAEYFAFDQLLVNVASYHVNLIAKYLFHVPMELLTNGRFQILNAGGTNILKLGIECSAVLESAILFSLVLFYPLFNPYQKALRITFGLIITYVINIARLIIIVLMAYKFGSDYIFLAHAGVARIFFFVCELILYWYLMTKPTVKSVGESILNHKSPVKTAIVGLALKLRHAITQMVIIFIFISLTLTSFLASNEWHKAFKDISRQPRPIIYQDETTLTPVSESTSGLYQEIALDLLAGEKNVFKYDIQKEEELNVQILEGQEDLAARLLLNGKKVELVSLPSWLFGKEPSIFKPFSVKPGDVLELRFQNLSEEEPSQYLVKIYPRGEENVQICTLESLKTQPTPKPKPTPSPEVLPIPKPPTKKSVAGDSSTGFYQEIALDLLAGERNVFKFDILEEEKLNIQVLEGQEGLAARVIINDDEIGFVSFAPWRFDKYTSIFEPIKVKPGDVLEVTFQNLSEEEPAQYLIKIYPEKEEDE